MARQGLGVSYSHNVPLELLKGWSVQRSDTSWMGISAVTPFADACYRAVQPGEGCLSSLIELTGHRISYHTAVWPWAEYNSAAFALSCICTVLMETQVAVCAPSLSVPITASGLQG